MQVCDRCDGAHPTHACTFFRKEREQHPDALVRYNASMDASRDAVYRVSAQHMPMPGDGSCLFHSLNYGTPGKYTADMLRVEIAYFIGKNPSFEVSGSPLSDWIRWDSNMGVSDYVRRIAWNGAWGGGIEIAVYAHLFECEVHVYERDGYRYKRISCFAQGSPKAAVSVLYVGGTHYDALVV
jgi:hypothetical protein